MSAPDTARVAAERARALMDVSRHEDALETITTALAHDPADPVLLALRGHALVQLGRDDDAAEAIRAGLAVRPDSADLHVLWSFVLDMRGDRVGAYTAALEATRLAPMDPETHRRLARVLIQDMGTREVARSAASRALELAPHDPDCHTTMAVVLAEIGTRRDREAARAHLAEALRLAPNHPSAVAVLARLDLRTGRLARATRRIARQTSVDGGRSAGEMALALRQIGASFTLVVLVQVLVVAATSSAPWVGRVVSLVPPVLLAAMVIVWGRAVPRGRRAYLRRYAADYPLGVVWMAGVCLACVIAIVVAWLR